MSASSFRLGQKIELNDGRTATIRFVGTTSFQTGDWIGVELDEPTGKNDGAVKGQRYFECSANHGVFLRPSGVRQLIEQPPPPGGPAASNGVPAKTARPSSMHAGVNGLKRQSMVDGPSRRASGVPASPTPTPGLARRLPSPSKSPTKQLGNNGVSSTSTSRTSTPPAGRRPAPAAAAARSRPSMAPPTARAARKTSTLPGQTSAPTQASVRSALTQSRAGPGTSSTQALPTRAASNQTLDRPQPGRHVSSTTEETEGGDTSGERAGLLSPEYGASDGDKQDHIQLAKPNFAPPPIPPDPPPPATRPRRPSSPGAVSTHSQRTIRSTTAANKQIEELEAKVRLLERKRQEDRVVKKSLEQAQLERDQYKGIIEKLQTKYRPQQQEIAELKQALSDAEKRFTEVEKLQAEHDSVVELAFLDREMAEEKAESAQAELDALRAKNEEMELELEILREENSDLSQEMTPEERNTAGWAQLQKSNERLREALLRLRDVMQDKQSDFNEKIRSLEDQMKDFEKTKSLYDETKDRLLHTEADTNELRQQLEAALESEEMIEELTDRNGRLEATLSQLRTTIEELEDLKELNDELEVNHVESEKQLQEELDFRDSLLLDRDRMAKQQQEALDEADYTITRYRALVSQMQSDLADMQASKQLSETEATELNNKTRAILDLNMKLQSSAAKTQVKTLDLELRKLEAQEASEHLAIVQLFLPEAFHAERDSVLALLRFKRIGFKAILVHRFVKERVASFGTRGQDEDVFPACDVMDKLTWIAAMAERFINAVCGCPVEDFAKFDNALFELEPVERALNGYIDGLRREELREKAVAEELQRSVAVMSHLASLHIRPDDLASRADECVMRTLCLQSQLEGTALALQLCRSLVENNMNTLCEDKEDDEGKQSDLQVILNRADALISHARSAKVLVGKTHRLLVDLQSRSLTLEASCLEFFDQAETMASNIAAFAHEAGAGLQMLFGEEGRTEPFLSSEVSSVLSRISQASFSLQAPDAGAFTTLAMRLRELTDVLADLAALPADLDNTVEFERSPAPWVARANELKQTKMTSIDTEAQLKRALEDLRTRDVTLKEKETELEEQSVRIEMLEARMKEASKRSAKIAELERALHEAKDAETRTKHAVAKAQEEKERELARVREEMDRLADDRSRTGDGKSLADDAMGAVARLNAGRQAAKIVRLEGAVRCLTEENHRLRLPPPDSPLSIRATLDWLQEPLVRPPSEKRRRDEAIRKEGKHVLQRMLTLVDQRPPVDLTKTPENRLAWRPAKETSRWRIEARKEEWERWRAQGRHVVEQAGRSAGPKWTAG